MILEYKYLIGFEYTSKNRTIEIKEDRIIVGHTKNNGYLSYYTIELSELNTIETKNDSLIMGYFSYNNDHKLVKEIINYQKVSKRDIIIDDILG